MVLVLIVFIVFKSVFLYVEGNSFLNTKAHPEGSGSNSIGFGS